MRMIGKNSTAETHRYGDRKEDVAGKELFSDADIGMNALDRILELLQDSQWHSVDEIKAQIHLPAEKLAPILAFFAELEFIELMDENTEVTITPLGLSFLELPSETLSTKHF